MLKYCVCLGFYLDWIVCVLIKKGIGWGLFFFIFGDFLVFYLMSIRVLIFVLLLNIIICVWNVVIYNVVKSIEILINNI